MNKETLRMQMLAGIITESQYKSKLKENDGGGKIRVVYQDPILDHPRSTYDERTGELVFPQFFEIEYNGNEIIVTMFQSINLETNEINPFIRIDDIHLISGNGMSDKDNNFISNPNNWDEEWLTNSVSNLAPSDYDKIKNNIENK
jgi:hypothetical protein